MSHSLVANMFAVSNGISYVASVHVVESNVSLNSCKSIYIRSLFAKNWHLLLNGNFRHKTLVKIHETMYVCSGECVYIR